MVNELFKQFRRWYFNMLISILEEDGGEEYAYFEYKHLYKLIYGRDLEKDLDYYRKKAKENYSIVLTKTGKKRVINNVSMILNDISMPR